MAAGKFRKVRCAIIDVRLAFALAKLSTRDAVYDWSHRYGCKRSPAVFSLQRTCTRVESRQTLVFLGGGKPVTMKTVLCDGCARKRSFLLRLLQNVWSAHLHVTDPFGA